MSSKLRELKLAGKPAASRMLSVRAVLTALLFFAGLGCSAQGKMHFDKKNLVLTGRLGEVAVKAEIARTDKQRAQGLMFRKELKDGEGMLFVFEKEQRLSFWMKNTLIPLSIAFISSDGKILEIRNMQPHDLSPVNSARMALYALEVPQGWFERAGLRSGDRLVLEIF
ncbi:MAG: DUF192 domain-containing protein [Treponema sp.]|jgi:uncharacterized membrane protein (UPF0127 family)|nr:DUF192 domain-containing protein [Treponema sp.]